MPSDTGKSEGYRMLFGFNYVLCCINYDCNASNEASKYEESLSLSFNCTVITILNSYETLHADSTDRIREIAST